MSNSMTAVVQYALTPGSVEVRELPIPEIGEDEVLDTEEVALDEQELGLVPVAAGLQGARCRGVGGWRRRRPAPR